jgi:hypothetical protein
MRAYGMDCDPIASGMLVDIPECETWLRSEKVEEFGTGDYNRGRSHTMINKFVSSSLDPAVAIDKPADFMSQLHYVSGDRDIFFFINYGPEKSNTFEAAFKTGEKIAWLWDPETGNRYLYPSSSSKNRLTITLAPSESKLIVFESASLNIAASEPRALSSFSTDTIKSNTTEAIIHGPWELMLNHVDGTAESLELQEPHDFIFDDHLKSFAGTAFYRNHFSVSDSKQRYWLDFGRLHCVSELEINGIPQGSRWYGDHLYEVSSALHPGEN